MFTTSGTYPWSFVTQIFHNGHPSHGGDNTVSLRICLNPSAYCINVDCLIVSILYQLFSMSLNLNVSFSYSEVRIKFCNLSDIEMTFNSYARNKQSCGNSF